jgi:hypothetical protein
MVIRVWFWAGEGGYSTCYRRKIEMKKSNVDVRIYF